MKHECSGCPYWKWHPKDRLYGNPGYHYCDEPDYCERFDMTKIQREPAGFITDDCLKDMHNFPLALFAYPDKKPYRIVNNARELEDILFGALPYVLTSHYRKNEEVHH